MNANDTNLLLKLASSLSKFVDDNERISLPSFSFKLASAKNSYPEDYTIGMLSNVVAKMADNDKLFISRSEVKDLFEKFYTRNTKFASVFSDELGKMPEAEKPVAPVESSITDLMNEAHDSMVDPVLASALDKAFGGNSVKEYSESFAKLALRVCKDTFAAMGLRTISSVLAGKNKVVICSVGFETPRGTTSVLVPVEAIDNLSAYSPDIFIDDSGVHQLTKDTIVEHIVSNAGKKLTVRAEEVLEAAMMATGSNTEISDVDLALIKLNSLDEPEQLIGPQITGVQIESANPNAIVNMPKIEDAEIMAAAKIFDTDIGMASFKFGSKLIAEGNALVERQLKRCGFDSYSTAVSSSDDESITYSVSLNGGSAAFTVPVKVEANSVFQPSIIICNGSIADFERASLVNLVRESGFDRAAAQSASPLYGVKPSELVATVKSAIADKNYIKAEDALNILSQSDDEKAYDIALNAFTRGLGEQSIEKVASAPTCNNIIRHAHSQHDICGHTGLPLDKIYVDKQGFCARAYRQNIDNSSEGGYFSDSKIYI